MKELIKPIEKEMKESYIDYSMSVIIGRALPDVRDGLKPVHRRILFAMHAMGNTHSKAYKKCARIVGETLGKFHPHGDLAVYNSLVRMAQDFSMRYELIDGQGNFGSVDGDSAAAMRYTEARLSKISDEILKDIEKETVNFTDNFDGSLQEPVVLPTKIPTLLVNGSSGIAVGMATNMLPHNLGEVVDALIMTIDTPSVDLTEILKVLPGPDFPTGGTIMGKNGILNAYKNGRGSIRVNAKAEIVETKKGMQIRITELPYQTNKASLIGKIASLVKHKKLEGVRDIRDMSDRRGMLVLVDIDKGFDPDVVLKNLYQLTDLSKTYGIINLAIVNGIPKQLNMKQLLNNFIDFRRDIVLKRTKFDLKKAEERKHLVEGLITCVNNIDETVKIVKQSNDPKEASEKLMSRFNLSEVQAKAILDMKLQKLTGLERSKLEDELKDLQIKIKAYKTIIDNESVLMQVIRDELLEIKEKYGDKRKTEISNQVFETFDNDELVNDDQVVIILTQDGYVKRVQMDEYRAQGRGGKGVIGMKTKEDMVDDIIAVKNRDWLLVFTEDGKVYWIKAYQIPEMGRYAKGRHIKNLLQVGDSKVRTVIPVNNDWKGYLFAVTEKGYVKRTELKAYSHPRSNGIIALSLRENDRVVGVKRTEGEDDIIIITHKGLAIRFDERDARSMGRTAQGVRGIRLKKEDRVVALCVAKDQTLTITENGYGKRTAIEDYRKQKRGGKGVIGIKTTKGNVVSAHNVTDEDEVILLSTSGKIVRIAVNSIRVVGRNTVGVRLMRLDLEASETVVASSVVASDQNENGSTSADPIPEQEDIENENENID
ncbi:DNA gyrase subunit A [Candidatus Micrarchaeota archaeon]|nr:DNA gyrase subunit A [Candidatus Micrarchaeota archaeon]